MTSTPVIETHNLRKVFGHTVAVDSLNLTVQRGEVFGFLGPNGAGKTTAMKMLLGLVTPTAGSATLLGRPLGDRQARGRMGFLPEHFRFHQWLTAAEFLDLHGRLHGMPANQRRRRVPELLHLVGLSDQAGIQLGAFSKGMLQRIGLAQALINEPELVFLDEPTSGLDPLGRRLVRDIIKGLRQRGTTVFLNSHFLSEVELTCDRVAFIKRGQVVCFAEVGKLVDGQTLVELRVGQTSPELVQGLARWGQDIRVDGQTITLTIQHEDALPAIASYVVGQGVQLFALTPRRVSLEELFVSIIGPGEGDG